MQGIRSFLHIMCLIEKRKNAEIWEIYNIEYGEWHDVAF